MLKEARDAFAEALAAFGAAEDGPLLGRFAAGTVAEPGIADKDNIGTGVFFPAANQLGLVTNGVQRALLSSTALQLDVKTKIGADLFHADPATGRVGVGTTAPTGILEVNSTRQFDPADANSNSHVNIVQAGGTPGEGNYGASVVLSKIASGRPGGAMASVQTGPDPDQMGLAFFTHLASTSSNILLEQFRIGHAGEMLARLWEGSCTTSGLGAPMESGSNANGQYFRFANGLQIQQRSVSIDMAATGAVSFDLPAANTGRVGAFISAGVQEALPFATAQTLDVVVTMPSDGSSWSVSPAAWAATTGTYSFMLISIDRWK